MAILALQVYDWQSGMKTLSSRQWFQKKTWPVADVSGILLVKIERTMLLPGLLIACARSNPGAGYGMQAIGCRLWDIESINFTLRSSAGQRTRLLLILFDLSRFL